MEFKFSFYLVFLVVISAKASFLTKMPHVKENLVSLAIKNVLNLTANCQLVLAHDYSAELPEAFETILTSQASRNEVHISVRWKNEILRKPDNPRHIEYGFSWMDRPWRKHQGTCVTYAVICKREHFQNLMNQIGSMLGIDNVKNRFIFWIRNNDIMDAAKTTSLLMHPYSNYMLYKVAIELQSNEELAFKTICFFCNKGEPTVEVTGYNDIQHGISTKSINSLFPDTSRNLHGKFLKGKFIYPADPATITKRMEHFQPLNYPELHMYEQGNFLNFNWNVEVQEVDNRTVDTEQEDGIWNGQVGHVLYKTADFGMTSMLNTLSCKVVDFPYPIHLPYVTYVTRKPHPTYGWKAIGQPFTGGMWLAIAAACTLGTFVFRALLWLQDRFQNPFHPRHPPKHPLAYSMIYMFYPLMEECPSLVPTSHTARLYLAFWWAYAIVITCAYDTMLIGFLVSPNMEYIPEDLETMLKYPKWKMGMDEMMLQYYKIFTLQSEFPYHHQVKQKLQPIATLPKCIQLTLEENFACLNLHVFLLPAANTFVDKYGVYPFQNAKEHSMGVYGGAVFPRRSILSPVSRTMTLRLSSSGLNERYHNEFYVANKLIGIRKSKAMNRVYETRMELKLSQLKGPLVLMIVFGWAVPLLAFIIEHSVSKKEKQI